MELVAMRSLGLVKRWRLAEALLGQAGAAAGGAEAGEAGFIEKGRGGQAGGGAIGADDGGGAPFLYQFRSGRGAFHFATGGIVA